MWNSEDINTWNASTKPSIRTTLNSTFLETIDSPWQEKIAEHTWKVGGMVLDNKASVKDYYNTEIGSSSSSTTDSMKIGLMYVSDYGYAAAPSNWRRYLLDYDSVISTNWLYLGDYEWTISCNATVKQGAFCVSNTGRGNNSYMTSSFAFRPSFYLESSVSITGGTGTLNNPYKLS